MSVAGRGKRRMKGLLVSIECVGLISILPFHGSSRVPHQVSPLSLFSVRQAPPSTLSLDFSSSQRRPAGLSLWPTGPGCHARGYRRFLREVVPAAGARQSSPLASTIPADDAPGERAIPFFERPVTLPPPILFESRSRFYSGDRINCPTGEYEILSVFLPLVWKYPWRCLRARCS